MSADGLPPQATQAEGAPKRLSLRERGAEKRRLRKEKGDGWLTRARKWAADVADAATDYGNAAGDFLWWHSEYHRERHIDNTERKENEKKIEVLLREIAEAEADALEAEADRAKAQAVADTASGVKVAAEAVGRNKLAELREIAKTAQGKMNLKADVQAAFDAILNPPQVAAATT